MDLELRVITAEELYPFGRAASAAFGVVATDDEVARWSGDRLELDRSIAVFDGDEIVANATAHSSRLTVPGGAQVPTAGVSLVGVRATHRRRGLLTRMMDEQLDDIAARGEPLAALIASESAIYRRFGYGPGTWNTWFELPTEGTTFARPSSVVGRVRLVGHDAAATIAQQVYDEVARTRVGEIARSDAWWDRVYRAEPGSAFGRGEDKKFFTVVHEDATGRADAFARYSITSSWVQGRPANVLSVRELHTTDAEAEAALWEYLVSVDLVVKLEGRDRPFDDPLPWRLSDPRRLRLTGSMDHLWVRVVDVAAALSARTYATTDALVLDLVDPFRPAHDGNWLLEGGPDGAVCARTERRADLTLSAADLGALYLGGVDAGVLARAGRVEEHTAGALARADRFFRTHPLPWCTTRF